MRIALLLLSACGMSAGEKAILVCEALPALSLDAAGRALVVDHMNPDELAIWQDGELSPGMRQIGTPAFGAIRANSSCSIRSKESTEEKGVHYRLLRSEPVITEMRVFDRHEIIDQEKADREVQVWIRDHKTHVESVPSGGCRCEATCTRRKQKCLR